MSFLDLSFALYASPMPDRPGRVDMATVIEWAETGLMRLGPSGVDFCGRRICQPSERGQMTSREAVYGRFIPGKTGVTASEARRSSALRLAQALTLTPGYDTAEPVDSIQGFTRAVRRLTAGQPGMRRAA